MGKMGVAWLSCQLLKALGEAFNGASHFHIESLAMDTESDMDTWSARYLPQDDLENVLQWLPASSLARFRSVSKSWHEFLAPPYLQDDSGEFEDCICVCSPGVADPPVPIEGVKVLTFDSFLPEAYRKDPCFFSDGRLLGVAVTTYDLRLGRNRTSIGVFNPADRSWTNLPVLTTQILLPCGWRAEVVIRGAHFQVFLFVTRRRRSSSDYLFYAFSSCTGAWEELSWKPKDEIYNPDLSYVLEHFDVSQEFLYTRRSLEEYTRVPGTDDLEYKVDFLVLRFCSKDGQYVSTLPGLPRQRVNCHCDKSVLYEEPFQVVTDQNGAVYWIADRCDIWKLDQTVEHWVHVDNLPFELEEKMRPPGLDDDLYVPGGCHVLKSVQIFGNIMLFVATQEAREDWGANKVVWVFGFHLLQAYWIWFGGPFDEALVSATFLGFGPWMLNFENPCV